MCVFITMQYLLLNWALVSFGDTVVKVKNAKPHGLCGTPKSMVIKRCRLPTTEREWVGSGGKRCGVDSDDDGDEEAMRLEQVSCPMISAQHCKAAQEALILPLLTKPGARASSPTKSIIVLRIVRVPKLEEGWCWTCRKPEERASAPSEKGIPNRRWRGRLGVG